LTTLLIWNSNILTPAITGTSILRSDSPVASLVTGSCHRRQWTSSIPGYDCVTNSGDHAETCRFLTPEFVTQYRRDVRRHILHITESH
jgi:hypothetical protein